MSYTVIHLVICLFIVSVYLCSKVKTTEIKSKKKANSIQQMLWCTQVLQPLITTRHFDLPQWEKSMLLITLIVMAVINSIICTSSFILPHVKMSKYEMGLYCTRSFTIKPAGAVITVPLPSSLNTVAA